LNIGILKILENENLLQYCNEKNGTTIESIKELFLFLYRRTGSYYKVADELGISRGAMSNIIKKLNLQTKPYHMRNTRLTSGDIWLIKKLLENNIKQTVIAKMFLLSDGSISLLKNGKTWKQWELLKENFSRRHNNN